MQTKFNVIMIGAGISSLISAYKLKKENPSLSILILEKGNTLDKRKCFITNGDSDKCLHCHNCAIMNGEAGAGAFSDGKFGITTEYGGWLTNYLSNTTLISLIDEVSSILNTFSDEDIRNKTYLPSDYWKQKCLQLDLNMKQGKVIHFGTDGNYKIMSKLLSYLKNELGVLIKPCSEVTDVVIDTHKVLTEHNEYTYDNLIISPGRSGSKWFQNWCKSNSIIVNNNQVDIGVRVELPRLLWRDISKDIYEPKIIYRTKQYGDITRTFCFNDGGEVVVENTNNVLTVNGHANAQEEHKTNLSNFALLSTINFTSPFQNPIDYATHVSKLANMITNDSVLVQRFGDLKIGRRTNEKRIKQNSFEPSLKSAVPGDLSLCLPKRQLDNIIETLEKLNELIPGTSNYDTILYGVEAKYYSARPNFIDDKFHISENIYAIGDGSGVTRSLAQAAAHGLFVAYDILR